mmetsp:Transcript_13222/g.41819  ORF Transcript_13222/g.41819 Transcript_13222/m.41819 type:complete len:202 (+) Transcript_13222:870-1475(+)
MGARLHAILRHARGEGALLELGGGAPDRAGVYADGRGGDGGGSGHVSGYRAHPGKHRCDRGGTAHAQLDGDVLDGDDLHGARAGGRGHRPTQRAACHRSAHLQYGAPLGRVVRMDDPGRCAAYWLRPARGRAHRWVGTYAVRGDLAHGPEEGHGLGGGQGCPGLARAVGRGSSAAKAAPALRAGPCPVGGALWRGGGSKTV